MLKAFTVGYHRLPWTPRIEALIKDVSHRLQVNSLTVTVDLVIPRNASVSAIKINKGPLTIQTLEDTPSSFIPSAKEKTAVVATSFIPESTEGNFSVEVTLEGKSWEIQVLSIPIGDLKPHTIEQPFLFDLDGILDRPNFEIRVVSGWCFALNPLRITGIQARLDDLSLDVECNLGRKDTVTAYPNEVDAQKCGFECDLPDNKNDGTLTLECQIESGPWIEFYQSNLGSIRTITSKPDPEKPARLIPHRTQSVYSVDAIHVEQQKKLKTKIVGWIFLKDGPAVSNVRLRYRDKMLKCRYGVQREDVHQAFPGEAHAIYSGFELKTDDIPGNPNLVFEFQTENGGWIEFDQRKPAQIPVTYYTDKKIPETKSGVRANVETAQIGRRFGHQFMMIGWCFRIDGKPIEEIRVRTGKQTFTGKVGLKRKDVFAENKDDFPNSELAGFEIPLDDISRNAKLKFEYKNSRGRWTLFALEDFSRFPVSHFASQSEEKLDYNKWLQKYEDQLFISKNRAPALLKSLSLQPTISIIMPVYNTPEKYLRKSVQSVRNQYYQNWELCIADDASPESYVWPLLTELAGEDDRIHITRRTENGHICHASNSALELATGEWCTFLDHDDAFPKDALLRTVQYMNLHPEAGLFYSDEDKLDPEDNHHDPYFKPDWNPELLEGQNYLCHLTVTQSNLVREVGGFEPGLEGSQDWDLFLKITERLNSDQIVHIPYLLYHWRAIEGSTALALEEKGYIRESSLKTLQGHCRRSRPNAEIIPIAHGHWRLKYQIPRPAPKVTIIIPTKDQAGILRNCVESIHNRTTYPDYEILIIDNQSTGSSTKTLFKELESKDIRILPYPHPFNFSSINNYAATQATGDYLTFLNNDVTIINGDWLEEMVSHACKEKVGAVGSKLYFPEDCIQHAGVILGINGVAGHCFKYATRGEPGQRNRLNLVQQYTAVTAACMVVRKSIFEEVNGFEEEHLGVAFNDIDLCLRIKEAGYVNIWTPHAQLYHHESLSRGDDNDQTRKIRVDNEIDYMRKRWGDQLRNDPTYNPNLTLEFEDFSLAWPPRLPHP